MRNTIAMAAREQIVQQVEMRCYRKNGTLFEAELSISSITAAMTDTARFVCTLRDITERKQAQTALAEERNLIDTIPAGICIKDLNHRFCLSNIAGARIMEDMRQLAELETRRTELNPVWFDLDALGHSILDEFQSRPDGSHRLAYSCDDALGRV